MAQSIQMTKKNDSGVYENMYPDTVMSQVEGSIQMKAKVVITADAGDRLVINTPNSTINLTIGDDETDIEYFSYGTYTFENVTKDITKTLLIDTIKTYEVLMRPKTLDEYSWAEISEISRSGDAANNFAVGDTKGIILNGNIISSSYLTLSNYSTYVYILGFDHDQSSASGTKDGITFGTFKTAAFNGTDVVLCASNYDGDSSGFCMNTSYLNSGGWKNSYMRYTVLGSTNTRNGNATSTTATSPVSNTLMSCLPSDLRAVMRPMYIYTDNTGGGSNTASYVTGTLDYLPLLAEFEVYGTKVYANSAEQNYQTRYQYYKNGNDTRKTHYAKIRTFVHWWVRSVYCLHDSSFCQASSNGNVGTASSNYSYGIAPMFKI